jgi:hypothetical protein
MSATPLTIGEFFGENLDEDVVIKSLEPEKQDKLGVAVKGIPELTWKAVSNEVGDAYRSLFKIDMLDIFCGAWGKLKELQEYRDRDKHPPGEVALLPLAEHTISSRHEPKIDILLGEKRLFEIPIEVILKFKLKSFVLKIQDGCIHEVKSGAFAGAGIIKCGGQKLVEKKSGDLKLPGNMTLKQGFQIPRLM